MEIRTYNFVHSQWSHKEQITVYFIYLYVILLYLYVILSCNTLFYKITYIFIYVIANNLIYINVKNIKIFQYNI